MKVYVVRHGQTDSNKNKLLMGQRVNESLNAEGFKQAESLSEKLKSENFDIIFSSPLKRAEETAEIIKKRLNVPIKIDDRLKERDFGSLSGKNWSSIEGGRGNSAHNNDIKQRYDYSSFGGESAEDVKKRLLDFLNDVKKKYKNKKVLIIAHGGIMKMMQHLFEKRKDIFTPANAKLFGFDI